MRPIKKTIRPPILPKELESTKITRLDGLDLDQCRIDACALSTERAERVRFDSVHLVGGTLRETKVTHLTWLDVLCERGDLSLIDWPGPS